MSYKRSIHYLTSISCVCVCSGTCNCRSFPLYYVTLVGLVQGKNANRKLCTDGKNHWNYCEEGGATANLPFIFADWCSILLWLGCLFNRVITFTGHKIGMQVVLGDGFKHVKHNNEYGRVSVVTSRIINSIDSGFIVWKHKRLISFVSVSIQTPGVKANNV